MGGFERRSSVSPIHRLAAEIYLLHDRNEGGDCGLGSDDYGSDGRKVQLL
jgi:hypothetical protein